MATDDPTPRMNLLPKAVGVLLLLADAAYTYLVFAAIPAFHGYHRCGTPALMASWRLRTCEMVVAPLFIAAIFLRWAYRKRLSRLEKGFLFVPSALAVAVVAMAYVMRLM
jgi:hypothetical protein